MNICITQSLTLPYLLFAPIPNRKLKMTFLRDDYRDVTCRIRRRASLSAKLKAYPVDVLDPDALISAQVLAQAGDENVQAPP